MGYDAVWFARIARQREAALFPRAFEPAEAVPEEMGFKKWESLTLEERQFEARRMEVYAAMVENLDWNIGRLVDQLKANGLYDNALIIFTASSTGAQTAVSHASTEGLDNSVDNIGRKNSWISYSERWAEVSNAPFSRWKAKATEGGTVVPFIVRLPGQQEQASNSDTMALKRGDTAKANAIRADRPLRWTLFNIEQDRGETDDLAARRLYQQYAERNGIPLQPRE